MVGRSGVGSGGFADRDSVRRSKTNTGRSDGSEDGSEYSASVWSSASSVESPSSRIWTSTGTASDACSADFTRPTESLSDAGTLTEAPVSACCTRRVGKGGGERGDGVVAAIAGVVAPETRAVRLQTQNSPAATDFLPQQFADDGTMARRTC